MLFIVYNSGFSNVLNPVRFMIEGEKARCAEELWLTANWFGDDVRILLLAAFAYFYHGLLMEHLSGRPPTAADGWSSGFAWTPERLHCPRCRNWRGFVNKFDLER